jgi:hypothetical protein
MSRGDPVKMRVAASVAVTVLVSAVLAGCQFVTPQQTARSYTPSDGVNGMVGQVAIRNVFLLTERDGTTASLIGALANNSRDEQSVTLQYTSTSGTQTEQLSVPAGGLLSLSTDAGTVNTSVPTQTQSLVLQDVKATPGGLFPITFTVASKSDDLRLPVLTGSFEQYATLVPTPTPTPTRTRRSDATPSPTDSSSTGAEVETPIPTPTDTLAG